MLTGRNLLARATESAMLEHDYRIVVANRALDQPLNVRGSGRHHDLESGHAQELRIDRFRVLRGRTAHRAEHASKSDRQPGLAARHVAQLRRLIAYLIEGAIEEARELDLANRSRPGHRGADGGTDEAGLGDRRVAHARETEFVDQSLGRPESAEHYVFAHHEGERVTLHFLAQRLVYSLNKR